MNKVKKAKSLQRRIERYLKYKNKADKWMKEEKRELKKLIKTMDEYELLQYGDEYIE